MEHFYNESRKSNLIRNFSGVPHCKVRLVIFFKNCNSLFIYQDESGDEVFSHVVCKTVRYNLIKEEENQSLCSFLYVLKQTCDEQTNNYMQCKGLIRSSQALSRKNEKFRSRFRFGLGT